MRLRAFALAERLGMTLDELGRRMSSQEFSEWVAYDAVVDEIRQHATREAEMESYHKRTRR